MLSSPYLPLKQFCPIGKMIGFIIEPLIAQDSRHLAVSPKCCSVAIQTRFYCFLLSVALALLMGLPFIAKLRKL